jgi:hypothetical protein
VAFDEDIASAAVNPAPLNPAGMGMRWSDVGSGNPDVAFAIPAVVSGVPGPVRMLVERGRNDFNGTRRRRADAYDNLCSGYASGQDKCAGSD